MIRIPLSQKSKRYAGLYEALIDEDDRVLTDQAWSVSIYKGRASAKSRFQTLANAVMERFLGRPLNRNELVYYTDGNPLNCRKANLTIHTAFKIRKIRKLHNTNSSGYPGVSYHQRSGLWFARITLNGKTSHLGYRKTAQAAYEELRQPAEEMLDKKG